MAHFCNRTLGIAAIFAAVSGFSAFAEAVAPRTAMLSGSGGETVEKARAAPIWFGPAGDSRRAADLIAALEEAPSHGLPPARYRAAALRDALNTVSDDPAAIAALDAALTDAFLRYARDLRSGLLEPAEIDRDLQFAPDRPDPDALMVAARTVPDMRAYFEAIAPSHPHYDRLRALLAELRAEAAAAGTPPAPEGASLREGDSGPRVAALRGRLVAAGDLAAPPRGAVEPTLFDAALHEAVRAFQRRHGLNDDGIAGRRTLAALNATPGERLGQVLVNLERLRWSNRELGERHVLVNQADFRVRLIDRGQTLFDERVIIGKARRHRTPEFSDRMTYLVLNPSWNVPRSIATKEILPLLRENPDYLIEENMELRSGVHDDVLPAVGHDWSLYSQDDFPFRLRQRPGPGNALGKVKFMFPNQFNIYLHDTPSKKLFAKDARAFSHGCVRVRDPLTLAYALLREQEPDVESFVADILEDGEERIVSLREPVPVHLTYRTAWVDDAGVRHFREDIYGRDARVLAALRAAGVRDGTAQ